MTNNRPAWRFESTTGSPGTYIRISFSNGYMAFGKVFELLAESHDAVYWEHPALTDSNVTLPYEVALIDAPALSTCRGDPRPFDSQFAACPGSEVTAFENLGGDATLIVPTPASPQADYAHLLSFLRTADQRQIDAFWRCAVANLRQNLSHRPIWLSTAGGGVNWLHVRIDSFPKYYKHPHYRHFA
jgi:hypothetical protein